jgi:cellulose biosynthesis protein BcsQ
VLEHRLTVVVGWPGCAGDREHERVGKVVAVVNQKGGVGKTTVATGFASAAIERGHRVLLVDLDPQGAATWVAGVDGDRVRRTLADAIGSGRGGAARDAVVRSGWGHLLDVVPSDVRLQRMEAIRGGLETLFGQRPELRLRRALDGVTRGYGVVLVDCPPSLGDLTTNALAAADEAVIVVEPTALSLRGVAPIADQIERVWERHNGELDLAGVVVNRMPARGNDASRRYDELSRTVGASSVWDPPVPHRVVVAEAAAERRPIHRCGARAKDVAQVFDALYERLWDRIAPRRD